MHLRTWIFIHKWTSLVSTIFLLVLCLTGLPLVFHEEIEQLSCVVEAPSMPQGTPNASLDKVVQSALAAQPHKVVRYMFWDEEEHPHITMVSMASKVDAPPDEFWTVAIDSRTAQVLDQPNDQGFMAVMLQLHKDLYAGLPGQLFLGLMGLLLVIAVISGVVVYKPFMRKQDFGTVRKQKGRGIKWLDLHNLLGIVLLAWTLVVGVTGLFNELSTPLTGLWELTEVPRLLAPYRGRPMPTAAEMVSPQTAMDAAKRALPGMTMRYIAYPGKVFGTSPQHYVIFARGSIPLTFELIQPVLVDARSGRVERTVQLPWYLKALELSRPLHFGDYGGLPLKVLWAALDFVTVTELGSGLYLWIARRRQRSERLHRLADTPT